MRRLALRNEDNVEHGRPGRTGVSGRTVHPPAQRLPGLRPATPAARPARPARRRAPGAALAGRPGAGAPGRVRQDAPQPGSVRTHVTCGRKPCCRARSRARRVHCRTCWRPRRRSCRRIAPATPESPVRPNEIIFEVTEAVEGGYDARALGYGELKYLTLALPLLPEQAAIVRFLDHADRRVRCCIRAKEKLTGAASRVDESASLIGEYRARLIAYVVTGKLDVREAAAELSEVGRPGAEHEPVCRDRRTDSEARQRACEDGGDGRRAGRGGGGR